MVLSQRRTTSGLPVLISAAPALPMAASDATIMVLSNRFDVFGDDVFVFDNFTSLPPCCDPNPSGPWVNPGGIADG